MQAEKHLTPALRQRLQQGGIHVEHLNVETALDQQAELAALVHKGVGNAGELAAFEIACEKRVGGACSEAYDVAFAEHDLKRPKWRLRATVYGLNRCLPRPSSCTEHQRRIWRTACRTMSNPP